MQDLTRRLWKKQRLPKEPCTPRPKPRGEWCRNDRRPWGTRQFVVCNLAAGCRASRTSERRAEGNGSAAAVRQPQGTPRVEVAGAPLPEAERAELAHNLVESLDGPADKDAASAWDAEIQRRLAEIDAGTAELIDREELRRRMRARIAGT